MRRLLLLTIAALAAPVASTAAPGASAGCWATVKLSSMPTSLVWTVNVTPLQHGRTLLPNAKPRIEIRRAPNPWRVFKANATAKPGVFRARVVFPAPGTWRLRVWDGFEPTCARFHTYAPVTVLSDPR